MWRVCIAPLPYSIGFLIYVISEWFANIIVGTVLAVVFLRVLLVVKVFYSSLANIDVGTVLAVAILQVKVFYGSATFCLVTICLVTFCLVTTCLVHFCLVHFCLGNILPR